MTGLLHKLIWLKNIFVPKIKSEATDGEQSADYICMIVSLVDMSRYYMCTSASKVEHFTRVHLLPASQSDGLTKWYCLNYIDVAILGFLFFATAFHCSCISLSLLLNGSWCNTSCASKWPFPLRIQDSYYIVWHCTTKEWNGLWNEQCLDPSLEAKKQSVSLLHQPSVVREERGSGTGHQRNFCDTTLVLSWPAQVKEGLEERHRKPQTDNEHQLHLLLLRGLERRGWGDSFVYITTLSGLVGMYCFNAGCHSRCNCQTTISRWT